LKDDIELDISPIKMWDFVRHTCMPLLV